MEHGTVSQPVAITSANPPVELRNEQSVAIVPEDSNNNTSLEDRERTADGNEETDSGAAASTSQQSPSVREIHKNSWLKKMPCIDKWTGKFPKSQKIEKFWIVFCVHNDKEAFLEFYENRRSAYSHMPLNSVSLSNCLHISPTIVAQGNDHEFVITLDTQVIRLAASTNEQMVEWMDTLSTKLREFGVLEPKDNLYSKEPMSAKACFGGIDSQSREDFSRLSLRDPNSPLPPVPNEPLQLQDSAENATIINSTTTIYIRDPSTALRVSPTTTNTNNTSPLIATDTPPPSAVETVFNFDPPQQPNHSTSHQSPIPSPPVQLPATSSSTPTTPSTELYEPLFYSGTTPTMMVRNPNYENPPHPQKHIVFKPTPALPPRIHRSDDSHRPISNLNSLTSASEPSLNAPIINQHQTTVESFVSNGAAAAAAPASSGVLLRTHSQLEAVSIVSERTSHPPLVERHQYNGARRQSTSSSFKPGTIPVDENGKPISLREAQVQQLQSEIQHKSGVRLLLRKRDCLNAIAFVECFNCVWVAGWKQKEHPLLHNTFHVGDRLLSIAGLRIVTVQDAHKAIKQQPSTVEFIVRRVPYGKILAIKREYEGQDLGLVREGGTAEIKEVKLSGLAFRQGLPVKAPSLDGISLCNWFLTEINHRPLNLFFKDNEVQDRLNAVGLDISLLVQPIELVKALRKQLKTIRSYKDYIVQ